VLDVTGKFLHAKRALFDPHPYARWRTLKKLAAA
jgi:hypothetical protein